MPDARRYLTTLRKAEPGEQELACDELADLLEAEAFEADEAAQVLTALVLLAAGGDEDSLQESALNALAAGVVAYPAVSAALDLGPVVAQLDALAPGALLQALSALGAAGQPAHRGALERLREHGHPDVRQAAAEALAQLDA